MQKLTPSTSPVSSRTPHIGRAGAFLTALTAIALTLTSAGSAEARPPEGGYIGIGFGYALVSGDRGAGLKLNPFSNVQPGGAAYEDIVRTDFGEGIAFELRFGWLFGPVAAEIGVVGHGTTDFKNGAGYPMLTVRFHPLMLVDSLVDLPFDFNVFVGAGYAIGGYHHDTLNDDKGWEGWAFSTGLGVSYDLSERVRIGLDLRFVLPQYSSFLVDWDDDIRATPSKTPSTIVTIPSLQFAFSF